MSHTLISRTDVSVPRIGIGRRLRSSVASVLTAHANFVASDFSPLPDGALARSARSAAPSPGA